MQTAAWADSYTLQLGSRSGTAAMAGGINSTACPRGYPTSSWLTDTTVGSHCWGTRFSSRYDCAATCFWDPSRLSTAQCTGLPLLPSVASNASAGGGASAACLLHLPCSPRAEDSPTAPDGPCYCCDLQLDAAAAAAEPQVPAGQLWTLIVGQALFCAW